MKLQAKEKQVHPFFILLASIGIILLALQGGFAFLTLRRLDPVNDYLGNSIRVLVRSLLEIIFLLPWPVKNKWVKAAGFFGMEAIFHEVLFGSGLITLILTLGLAAPLLAGMAACLGLARSEKVSPILSPAMPEQKKMAPKGHLLMLFFACIWGILDQSYLWLDNKNLFYVLPLEKQITSGIILARILLYLLLAYMGIRQSKRQN